MHRKVRRKTLEDKALNEMADKAYKPLAKSN